MSPNSTAAPVSDTDDDAAAPIADPRMRRSVAADMKAIFAPLPRPSKPIAAESPPTPSEAPPAHRRGSALWWLLGLLAVAILAALLSWLLMPKPQFAPAPRHVAQKSALPIAAAAPAPSPATSEPAPAQPATPSPAEATAPASISTTSRDSPRTREPDRRPAARPRCGRYASEAWCLRGEIANADNRLRDTYEQATRAGVGRRIMVPVRNDWARLRHRANRGPRALIRGYAELTNELRRAMAGGR